jgi:hypothetical protein
MFYSIFNFDLDLILIFNTAFQNFSPERSGTLTSGMFINVQHRSARKVLKYRYCKMNKVLN